jgi:hypothetical protein
MHVSRSKIPTKNLVRQRCAEGFNSGVTVLAHTTIICLEELRKSPKNLCDKYIITTRVRSGRTWFWSDRKANCPWYHFDPGRLNLIVNRRYDVTWHRVTCLGHLALNCLWGTGVWTDCGLTEFRFRNSFESKDWEINGRRVRRILRCRINEMKLAQLRALTGSYVGNVGVCCHYLCTLYTVVRFNDGA